MRALAATIVLVGCGSPAIPPSIANTPPAPLPVVAPKPVETIDLGAELRAIAKVRLPKLLERPGTEDIPAFGPCTRPNEAERAKLRARIENWLRGHYPREALMEEEPTSLRFGCVDRAGTVVDVAVDTRVRGTRRGPPTQGHWLTVRVAAQVSSVIEASGIPSIMGGEWAVMTRQTTLALADLDRDGAFDVISVNEVHEGGAMTHDLVLTTILATGTTATFGTFGDFIELAPQPFDAGRAVVVRIRDPRDSDDRVILRCVDGTAQLATTCPELPAARRLVDAERAAARLVEGPPVDVFDRDEVTELVDLLAVPGAERARLIAAAPVVPARTVARAVDRFARDERGADRLLTYERAALRTRDHATLTTAAFAALGDAECPSGPPPPAVAAKVRAWITANERQMVAKIVAADADLSAQCKTMACAWEAPSRPTITMPCGAGTKRYLIADWSTAGARGQPPLSRRAVLFSDGDKLVSLGDLARHAMFGPWGGPPPLDPQFHRRGDTLIATLIADRDRDTTTLATVADGVVVDRRTGKFEFYEIRPLVIVRSAGGELWHAGPAFQQVVRFDQPGMYEPSSKAPNGLAALVLDHEVRLEARRFLATFDRDLREVDDREAAIRALTVLAAPVALIDRVRAVR